LSRSKKAELVTTVEAALASSSGQNRDALIEGLGRMPIEAAGALLAKLSRGPDVDDRRKVAEALAGHPKQESALIALVADPDATVRANAAWSLAKVGGAAAIPKLASAVSDLDVAVAGNAAAALAR